MSYTSGRTVRSTGRRVTSPTTAATKALRAALKDSVGEMPGMTINSRLSYDMAADVATVVSVITYPAGTDVDALTTRINTDTATRRVSGGPTAMTVTRTA
jgi:hypothetical protein